MKTKIEVPQGFELVQTGETTWNIQEKATEYPIKLGDIKTIENTSFFGCNGIETNGHKRLVERDDLLLRSDGEKFMAMFQLRNFMHAWNRIDNGGKDWEREAGEMDYSIQKLNSLNSGIEICVFYAITPPTPIHFKREETAKRFLEQFHSLIEEAGDLI